MIYQLGMTSGLFFQLNGRTIYRCVPLVELTLLARWDRTQSALSVAKAIQYSDAYGKSAL